MTLLRVMFAGPSRAERLKGELQTAIGQPAPSLCRHHMHPQVRSRNAHMPAELQKRPSEGAWKPAGQLVFVWSASRKSGSMKAGEVKAAAPMAMATIKRRSMKQAGVASRELASK